MRRIICYTCVFVMLLMLCPVPVLASETSDLPEGVMDFSGLKIDDDGRYWLYFEFNSDDFYYVNSPGVSHSAHLSYWVDVTDRYLSYGHPRIAVRNDQSTGLSFIPVFTPSSTNWDYNFFTTCIVKGDIDGVDYELELDSPSWSLLLDIGKLTGVDSVNGYGYIAREFSDCFSYLPVCSRAYMETVPDDLVYYDYLQDKPPLVTPAPQEPVFGYEETFDVVYGLKMYLRYPFSSAEDFYSGKNQLNYIPLVDQITMDLVDTYVDYRFTVLVDGEKIITSWVPVGSVPYVENPVFDFFFTFKDINKTLNFASYIIGTQQGFDSQYLIMRLDKLPQFLKSLGIHVSDDSRVILTKVEVIAQNYHTYNKIWSDQVYSSYDLNTNEQVTDVIPVTEGTGHTVVESTDESGNTIIVIQNQVTVPENVPTYNPTSTPSGNTEVVPVVNGDGSSGSGSSDFGDSLLEFFDFILGLLGTLISGIIKVLRLIMSLIGDLISLAGDVPKLFGFFFDSLPAEFGTLFTLGLILGLVSILRGR